MTKSFASVPAWVRQRWRRELYTRQAGKCHWCSGYMTLITGPNGHAPWDYATFEHLTPRSQGGKDKLPNLVLAHRKCNEERGTTHWLLM